MYVANFSHYNKVYGSLSTGGSRAVRETGEMVQQAGASARERLIAAAARRWNVPTSDCAAAMSKITHKPTGRTFRYGELAVEAAAIKLDKEPAIKKPDQFKFIGRRLSRLDARRAISTRARLSFCTTSTETISTSWRSMRASRSSIPFRR